MQRFEDARVNVEVEALTLADTFCLATVLPNDLRISLQSNSLKYARIVADKEWDR